MGRSILPPDVMDIVGGHQRDAELITHRDEGMVHLFELGNGLTLYFEVEIAEYLAVPLCRLPGVLKSSLQNQSRHLPYQTTGEGNKPLVVLLQKLPVHPRTVVKAFEMGFGYYLDKVLVAGIVLGQKNEMIMVSVDYIAAEATSRRHVYLTADDGLYPRFSGGAVELDDAVHSAVVGYGQAVHTQLFGPCNQLRNAAHAIEQTVFGMDVKMRKHSPCRKNLGKL